MKWEEIWGKINNPTSLKKLNAWSTICSVDRCFMCSTKMNLIIPMPEDTSTSFEKRLNTAYLFHLKSTHGLEPEVVSEWILNYINKVFF